MKKFITSMTAVLLTSIVSSIAFGQNTYVSQSAADALKSGKFYLKLAGTQSYSEEGSTMNVPVNMEIAARNGASMSRMHSSAIDAVSLGNGNYTYVLDEKAKTWRAQPSPNAFGDFGELRFRRQGTCVVNGQQGWYFDEYSAGGNTITFYYNSAKPAILDLGGDDEEAIGPLYLHSLTTTIPGNMYFCVGNDWKEQSGGGSAAAAAGIDMSAIEAQMRAQLKDADLPPGMNVEDLIKQALGSASSRLGGGAGAKTSLPAPPRCSTPWKDSGSSPELACGSGSGKIVITEKRTVKEPVYASLFKDVPIPTAARTDLAVTEAGIRKAAEKISKDIANLSDEAAASYFNDFDDKVSLALVSGVLTGEMIEMSIASSYLHPHPLTLATTGTLLSIIDEPEIAVDYFEEADEIEPNNIIVESGLVDCYMTLKQYDKARKVIPKIIEVYPNDGGAYRKRAELEIQEEDYFSAANDLFKSLSLGFFDETSASMIVSLLTAVDGAAISAYDGLEFKDFIDRVFSPANLELIKKGIAYDYPNIRPQGSTKSFTCDNLNGRLDAMITSNRNLYALYGRKSEKCNAIVDKVMEDAKKQYMLYWTMGFGSAQASFANLTDAAIGLSDTQKALAQHEKAKRQVEENNTRQLGTAAALEDSYVKLTKLWGLEDGLAGYFLPDSRTFWCLRLLDRYYEFRMVYASGALAHGIDRDNDGVADKLVGCFPPEVETRFNADIAENKRHESVLKALEEKYEKMSPSTPEGILRMQLSRAEDDLKATSDHLHALIRNYKAMYDALFVPEMQLRWKEMSSWPQYCSSVYIQSYFENRAFADLYEQWSVPFGIAASYGEEIQHLEDMVDYWREQLQMAKLQREAQQNAEVQAAAEAAQDERLFDHGTEQRISDFMGNIPTPIGTISFGVRNGEWGWMLTDVEEGMRFGTFGGVEFSERIYKTMAQDLAASGAHAKKYAQDLATGTVPGMLAKGISKGQEFKAAKAIYSAANGELVKFDRQTWHAGVIDSAGNLHQSVTDVRSATLAGKVTLTREITRIGAAKRDKTLVTFPLKFGSLTVGGY